MKCSDMNTLIKKKKKKVHNHLKKYKILGPYNGGQGLFSQGRHFCGEGLAQALDQSQESSQVFKKFLIPSFLNPKKKKKRERERKE